MPDDTGTQYAGLTETEKVLARADDHMSTCDEPQMADCETCTRRIGKYRKYLGVLADAGLLNTVGICGDRAADVFPNGPTRVCDLPAGHAGWHGAPNPPDASGIPSRMSWTVRDEPPTLRREWGAPRYGQPGDDIRPCPLAGACSDDTHTRWVSEWVETGRCGAEYKRAGGRERGDRIVRCDMPAGHDGFHCESATESEWPNDQLAPEVLPNVATDRGPINGLNFEMDHALRQGSSDHNVSPLPVRIDDTATGLTLEPDTPPPPPLPDLVDYLRTRLEVEASGPRCACPDIDVSDADDLRRRERFFVKGYDERCPVHGFDGTEPVYRRRYAS